MGRMAPNPWKAAAHAIVTALSGWIHREQEAIVAYQQEEIRALREMLGGKRLRFTDAQRRRLALKGRPLSHAQLRDLGSLVTPDTLTRWFRKYAGAKYDSHAKRGPGRPPKPQPIRDLVVRLADENVGWGYTRIRDVMRLLGHEIGRTTVQRILDEDGIVQPHRYLIMDRDPVFTQEFRARLARAGIDPIRLPRCSPNLNAFVERFNRSIQEECLDRVIPLGEAHLRGLVREYVAHYHEERPHQGLGGRLIAASTGSRGRGPLVRS